MTDDSLPLAELLAKAGDGDILRSVAEAVVQLLMETDAEGLIGAGRHERTAERQTFDTRLGTLQLQIQSCGRAATSRRSSSPGRPPSSSSAIASTCM